MIKTPLFIGLVLMFCGNHLIGQDGAGEFDIDRPSWIEIESRDGEIWSVRSLDRAKALTAKVRNKAVNDARFDWIDITIGEMEVRNFSAVGNEAIKTWDIQASNVSEGYKFSSKFRKGYRIVYVGAVSQGAKEEYGLYIVQPRGDDGIYWCDKNKFDKYFKGVNPMLNGRTHPISH